MASSNQPPPKPPRPTAATLDESELGTSRLQGCAPQLPGQANHELARAQISAQLFGHDSRVRRPQIGRFELERSLGRGGMGEVYLAHDPALDRSVAVKLLHPRRGEPLPFGEGRVRREAQALARVSHPNVVEVFEVGEHEGRPFVAMEYVEGQTLRGWLDSARRSWMEIVEIFIQAGRGLQAAHRAGLVHRDFKPDNVLVTEPEEGSRRVRVLDFGLARLVASEQRFLPTLEHGGDDHLTAAGAILGTPAFMAPEQLWGERADEAADQFAFCVALYRALWGEEPFGGRGIVERREFMASRGVRPPAEGSTPRRLWPVLARGLALAPDERWADMASLLRALEGILNARSRRRRVGGGLALLGLGAGLGLALTLSATTTELEPERCAHVERRAAGLWSPDRAAAARARFEASSAPYAKAAFELVDAELSGWSTEWATRRLELCQTDRDEGPRAACYDRSEAHVRAWIDALVQADAQTIANTSAGLSELPALEPCAEDEPLRFGLEPVPAALAERLAAHRQALTRVEVLRLTGHYVEANRELEGLEEEAAGFTYDVFLAELAVERGILDLARALDNDRAIEAIVSGAKLAERTRNDRLAVSAWLVGTHAAAADPRGQRPETADWLERADIGVERLGDPPEQRARVECTRGVLLGAEPARTDEAVAALERGLALLDGIDHGAARLERHRAMCLVGLAELRDGEAALALAERALHSAEAFYGEGHPQTAEYILEHLRLAFAFGTPGATARGSEQLERVTASWDRAHPDSRRKQARTEVFRAIGQLEVGEVARARGHLELADALYSAVLEPGDYEWAEVRLILGAIEFGEGDYAAALVEFDEARPFLVGNPKLELALADLDLNRARALLGLGRLDEAQPMLESLRASSQDPGVEVDLAFVLAARGRGARARAMLSELSGRLEPDLELERATLLAVLDLRAGKRAACEELAATASELADEPDGAAARNLERLLGVLAASPAERRCLGLEPAASPSPSTGDAPSRPLQPRDPHEKTGRQ